MSVVSVLEHRYGRTSRLTASPIRVMMVDDSAIARGFLRRWLESEPDIEIVAALRTGREAIEHLDRAEPDVVVLDIEMPEMDGITALPQLLQKRPGLAVIVASALTRRSAEVTMRALALGALDCIQKPDVQCGISNETFRHYLISKIRELGVRARRKSETPAGVGAPPSHLYDGRPSVTPLRVGRRPVPIALRPAPTIMPRVLVIGASTGGPQALATIFERLGPVVDQAPVLITQHMPPTFTTILAEHLARATGRSAREAEDGEPIRAGHIYVAPGNRHLRVARSNGQPVVVLDDRPPIHFCKPAVDVMFSSAAEVWGAWVLGLILTGMGSDGARGGADIVAAGGSIIAQDEASSIVWGMPGSAAEAGLCSSVLPLGEIAPALQRLFLGRRS